jgi:hypothetical protein
MVRDGVEVMYRGMGASLHKAIVQALEGSLLQVDGVKIVCIELMISLTCLADGRCAV